MFCYHIFLFFYFIYFFVLFCFFNGFVVFFFFSNILYLYIFSLNFIISISIIFFFIWMLFKTVQIRCFNTSHLSWLLTYLVLLLSVCGIFYVFFIPQM